MQQQMSNPDMSQMMQLLEQMRSRFGAPQASSQQRDALMNELQAMNSARPPTMQPSQDPNAGVLGRPQRPTMEGGSFEQVYGPTPNLSSMPNIFAGLPRNPDPGFTMNPSQMPDWISQLGRQPGSRTGSSPAARMPAPGRTIEKGPPAGMNPQQVQQAIGASMAQQPPRIPRQQSGGMQRVSPGLYRNQSGSLVKSKTGK